MLSRNDQPDIRRFNFGTDSVLNKKNEFVGNTVPPVTNKFLLLDGTDFLLLDGTDLLLL